MRKQRWAVLVAAATSLVLAGCGGSSDDNDSDSGSDTPVAGGVLSVTQVSEPRTLDPAALSQGGSSSGLLGNALYGTLVTYDPVSLAVDTEGSLAESLESTDGGTSFTLKLRAGLAFSDGSPLNAEAVKFNWDRLKDPTLGSSYILDALTIAESTVVDDTTLQFKLTSPIPTFWTSIANGALNWIASPAALQKGQAAFDAAPIGAGPFTLTSWTRGDHFEFAKNASYFNSPLPYLDGMNVRFTGDTQQRFNSLIAGQTDLSLDNSSATAAKADDQGFTVVAAKYSGGNSLIFNTRIAPFDDIRARQAIAYAFDRDALNTATYEGHATVATSLFDKDSPYYNGTDYPARDVDKAQELFDELAAEGKPVKFDILSFPTTESKVASESIQAMLSTFKNVEVGVNVLDFAGAIQATSQHQFQAAIGSYLFQDPGIGLYSTLFSQARQNSTGISDPELDQAVTAARSAANENDRKAALATVQTKFVELVPGVNYIRSFVAAEASPKVGGLTLDSVYAFTSPRPEFLWKKS